MPVAQVLLALNSNLYLLMITPNKVTDLDCDEVRFSLLCTYADILQHEKIIVEADGKYLVYKVVPPYPSIEEFLAGCEFEEESEPLKVCASMEEAKSNL